MTLIDSPLTKAASRIFPPNIEFRKVDVTEPFPFEPETFDVVHARLVFMHVRDVLRTASASIDVLA